jgi:hypothetical protein
MCKSCTRVWTQFSLRVTSTKVSTCWRYCVRWLRYWFSEM